MFHFIRSTLSRYSSPYKQPNLQGVTQYRHSETEKLFEESLHLKQLVNQLRDENVKLRTRNTNLEVLQSTSSRKTYKSVPR